MKAIPIDNKQIYHRNTIFPTEIHGQTHSLDIHSFLSLGYSLSCITSETLLWFGSLRHFCLNCETANKTGSRIRLHDPFGRILFLNSCFLDEPVEQKSFCIDWNILLLCYSYAFTSESTQANYLRSSCQYYTSSILSCITFFCKQYFWYILHLISM